MAMTTGMAIHPRWSVPRDGVEPRSRPTSTRRKCPQTHRRPTAPSGRPRVPSPRGWCGIPPRRWSRSMQTHLQVLRIGIGPSEEGIQQALLNGILFPDRRPLETHTFLGHGGSLMTRGVKDGAALEVSDVLHELNDRL